MSDIDKRALWQKLQAMEERIKTQDVAIGKLAEKLNATLRHRADEAFLKKAMAHIDAEKAKLDGILTRCMRLESGLELAKISKGEIWQMLSDITERLENSRTAEEVKS